MFGRSRSCLIGWKNVAFAALVGWVEWVVSNVWCEASTSTRIYMYLPPPAREKKHLWREMIKLGPSCLVNDQISNLMTRFTQDLQALVMFRK